MRIGAPLKLLTKIAWSAAMRRSRRRTAPSALAMQARGAERPRRALRQADRRDERAQGDLQSDQGRRLLRRRRRRGRAEILHALRQAAADWADGPSLRGFTFSYPREQADELDKVALAIANSFEPFSSSPTSLDASAARAASAVTWRDVVKRAGERRRRGERRQPAGRAVPEPAPSPSAEAAPMPTPQRGDRAHRRARPGADGASCGRMRRPDGRRQAGQDPARRCGERPRAARRRFRRRRRAAARRRRSRATLSR